MGDDLLDGKDAVPQGEFLLDLTIDGKLDRQFFKVFSWTRH